MAYDLALLTYTPDMRYTDPTRANIVNALRYSQFARANDRFCPQVLGNQLGCREAVSSFQVFLDEAIRAWPDPIVLHRACNPCFSYDEMLLADLCVASARNHRATFDSMTLDMLGVSARNAIWAAARRLMRHLVSVAE